MPLPLYSEEEKIEPFIIMIMPIFIQVTHLRSGYVGKAVNGGGLKELLQRLHRPLQRNLN